MTTLAEIEWEPPVLAPTRDAGLAQYVREACGVIPPMAPYFYACPWIVRAMVGFDVPQLGLVHLDRQAVGLVELVVSQDNACRYCYAVTRGVLKMLGFAEARIRQLESDLLSAEVDPRLRVALDFARRVSHANPLPSQSDVMALLDCGFAPDAVKEIIFVAAITLFYNRLATLAAVPTDQVERFERSSLARAAFAVRGWVGKRRRQRFSPPVTLLCVFTRVVALMRLRHGGWGRRARVA